MILHMVITCYINAILPTITIVTVATAKTTYA